MTTVVLVDRGGAGAIIVVVVRGWLVTTFRDALSAFPDELDGCGGPLVFDCPAVVVETLCDPSLLEAALEAVVVVAESGEAPDPDDALPPDWTVLGEAVAEDAVAVERLELAKLPIRAPIFELTATLWVGFAGGEAPGVEVCSTILVDATMLVDVTTAM